MVLSFSFPMHCGGIVIGNKFAGCEITRQENEGGYTYIMFDYPYELDTPTLIATIAEEMAHFNVHKKANTTQEIVEWLDNLVEHYSGIALEEYLDCDDFDDFLLLLLLAQAKLRGCNNPEYVVCYNYPIGY